MWWFWFTAFHKIVCVLGCFVGLDCFSLAVLVWHQCFSPQELHGAMLKANSCACETMYRLFFSVQDSTKAMKAADSFEQHNAVGH
jgi:hypothetical protein